MTLLAGYALASTDWVLTWSDEFEGSGNPDSEKWEQFDQNRKNNEAGPDGFWDPEDVYLDGQGHCVIRVRKVPNRNDDNDPYDYSVGALNTKGKFSQLYGRFECRAKLPREQGWWVAFWMMQGNVNSPRNGGVDGSEVDVMEAWGWIDRINHAVHWDGYGEHHKATGEAIMIPGIREGWHTFTMDWTPEAYIFYIDGKETYRTTAGGVCNQAGHLLLTGEITTKKKWLISEAWAKDPAEANYPDYFLVDYVRVYQDRNLASSTKKTSE